MSDKVFTRERFVNGYKHFGEHFQIALGLTNISNNTTAWLSNISPGTITIWIIVSGKTLN